MVLGYIHGFGVHSCTPLTNLIVFFTNQGITYHSWLVEFDLELGTNSSAQPTLRQLSLKELNLYLNFLNRINSKIYIWVRLEGSNGIIVPKLEIIVFILYNIYNDNNQHLNNYETL